MRFPGHGDGGLQSLAGLTGGKPGRATGNISRGIKHQHLASGAHERGESGLMQRPAHGDGGDVRALLGQRGGREQTIATIVSGPGQQHDRRVLQRQILVVQHTGRHVGRGLGGHAHQRHAFVQQGSLHGPDRIGVIGAVQQQFATIGVFGVFHGNPFPVFVTCGPCLQAVHLVGELFEHGDRALDLLRVDAVGHAEVSGHAEAVGRHEDQVVFLGLHAERHGVVL